MSLYALVDQSNVVQNVVQWDGGVGWAPPAGFTAVLIPNGTSVQRGYTFSAPSTFTFGQLPDQVRTGNRQSIVANAQAALAANATYQAIGAPSVAQNTAQIQSLTKQSNGIIRLLLNQLDSTTGT